MPATATKRYAFEKNRYRWPKGMSGNPKGSKKKEFATSLSLRWLLGLSPGYLKNLISIRELRNFFPQLPANPTYAELLSGFILRAAIQDAQNGIWSEFIACVLDRSEGKAPIKIQDERTEPGTTQLTILSDEQLDLVYAVITNSKLPMPSGMKEVIELPPPQSAEKGKEVEMNK